ncbi:MAG: hypothetical protein ACU0BK_08780 [Shimia sp.]|uniref:hypothetical protein n=1 Tax=Shimia sp. TaxID=1954381 RepID=UPI00405A1CB8
MITETLKGDPLDDSTTPVAAGNCSRITAPSILSAALLQKAIQIFLIRRPKFTTHPIPYFYAGQDAAAHSQSVY